MNFSSMIKQAGRLVSRHSPAILVGAGAAGVVLTAILTAKASFKAARMIDEEQQRLDEGEQSHPLDMKEKVDLVWKVFIPPVGTAVLTVGVIICAHRASVRRAAVLTAAYEISTRALDEYREQVVDTIGEKKERGIQEQLSQRRVDQGYPQATHVVVLGTGEILCYEPYTDRTFKSNHETIHRAVNAVNAKINNQGYAMLTDFYEAVGLNRTSISDEIGWWGNQIEISTDPVFIPDGHQTVGMAINYKNPPGLDKSKFRH
jgi:hypothetical protein